MGLARCVFIGRYRESLTLWTNNRILIEPCQ